MNNLPGLKDFGEQLDILKQQLKEKQNEQADLTAQSIFENYAFARDAFHRVEDELLNNRSTISELEENNNQLEIKLKDTLTSYNADFQLFRKFCNAQNHVNSLKSLTDLTQVLKKVGEELGTPRISIVLDRDLCAGLPCNDIPTFFMKGCMRYIDATLSGEKNRIFIGPISKMMRPDIFFGDPDMSPEHGGSCFAFGLKNKYDQNELIGLLAIHDPSPDRFHPEMGTDFLEHFCDSVASTLIDVITHQRAELLRVDVERITRHDLKTPLNAVINLPHLLLSSEKDEHKVEIIKSIQDAGYKMLALINRSYDIYRMESGSYDLVPSKVDLVQQLARVRMDLLNLIESKKSALKIFINGEETETGKFIIKGEELLLFSMLANLVKNGFEATDIGEPVTISLSDTDGIQISIHNSGAVPENIRDTFFEKYSTEGKAGGTGLGTYSASLIANAHGGNVEMETSADNGTTITVRLGVENRDSFPC